MPCQLFSCLIEKQRHPDFRKVVWRHHWSRLCLWEKFLLRPQFIHRGLWFQNLHFLERLLAKPRIPKLVCRVLILGKSHMQKGRTGNWWNVKNSQNNTLWHECAWKWFQLHGKPLSKRQPLTGLLLRLRVVRCKVYWNLKKSHSWVKLSFFLNFAFLFTSSTDFNLIYLKTINIREKSVFPSALNHYIFKIKRKKCFIWKIKRIFDNLCLSKAIWGFLLIFPLNWKKDKYNQSFQKRKLTFIVLNEKILIQPIYCNVSSNWESEKLLTMAYRI